MATILYARVSTAEQTIDHQISQAEAAGFKFDFPAVCDNGVSGVSTKLSERPNGKRLFDILRAGDTLVVRWIDRLGRNYEDITDVLREFMRRGVVIKTVINGFTFDGSTKDPVQKAVRDALIAFMAATAQAQAEVTKAAQRAGIDHAKSNGNGKLYLGRKPKFDRKQLQAVREMLARNVSITEISDETGVSRQTIYRIQRDPDAAEKLLTTWEHAAKERAQRALEGRAGRL
jgi:DNA invertase Pin-like site-specific DNA recombinase